ncbi:hypothetical protein AVEN_62216-1, partial [Araneus ventricosus]
RHFNGHHAHDVTFNGHHAHDVKFNVHQTIYNQYLHGRSFAESGSTPELPEPDCTDSSYHPPL